MVQLDVVNLYTKFEASILNGFGDMPIFNPMIQHVIVSLYTKFEVSILKGCGDIFAKKSGETEKRTNIGKNI